MASALSRENCQVKLCCFYSDIHSRDKALVASWEKPSAYTALLAKTGRLRCVGGFYHEQSF